MPEPLQPRLRAYWSKREHDLVVNWDAGCASGARYLLTALDRVVWAKRRWRSRQTSMQGVVTEVFENGTLRVNWDPHPDVESWENQFRWDFDDVEVLSAIDALASLTDDNKKARRRRRSR